MVKVHQLDVAIPLQLKSQLKKGGPGGPGGPVGPSEGDSDISDSMQFVMLTRKGNKQQVTHTHTHTHMHTHMHTHTHTRITRTHTHGLSN